MKITARRRELTGENGYNVWRLIENTREMPADKCALILCDVWDNHWSRAARERLCPMLPIMADFVDAARAAGVTIIHAPSDTLSFYEGAPARLHAQNTPRLRPLIVNDLPDVLQPIDSSDGGSDTNEPPELVNKWVWTRQAPEIKITEADYISDDGNEVYSILKSRGIDTVMIIGVHTNMCILNRPFAIKMLARWGLNPILIRDLTDPLYNPALPPYVSHEQGHELIVNYIESFYAESALRSNVIF